MILESFINTDIFTWIILPVLIFLARIIDVTISTLRIIFISRDQKYIVPVLGFFEILVWLLTIGQIFQNLNNWLCYIAYAAGFAAGNYVGMHIENKIAMGMLVIRIVTHLDAGKLIEKLKSEGFGITTVDGSGSAGPVKIIYTLIKRKDLQIVNNAINRFNPKAFFTIEDVRTAEKGIFPYSGRPRKKTYYYWGSNGRKAK